MCPANVTLPIETDTARGVRMGPPSCIGRHIAPIRHFPGGTSEVSVPSVPALLSCLPWQPPASCCVLGDPWLGWKASNISTRLSSGHFTTWVLALTILSSSGWICTVVWGQDSFLPLQGFMALLGICPCVLGTALLGSQEFPELLEVFLPQFCPEPHPSHSLWQRCCGSCPAQAGQGEHIQAGPS